MAKNTPSTTTIYQLVFGLAFLFVSYGSVRSMMYGSATKAKQIGFLAVALAVVLWLDKLYWLVLPLCMMLNVKIPGIPFDSTELGCIALVGIHFIRACLHRDAYVSWNRKVLAAFPLFFWICMIWVMNPAGMNMLGGSSMGGRFYLKIVLSFFAMICLSSIRLGEKECKLLFRILILGSLLSVALTVFNPSLLNFGDTDPESMGTRYVLLAFSGLYYLLWSRYSLPEIVSSLKRLFILFLSSAALALSGKRSVSASIALYPLYRVLLTGRNAVSTILIGGIAFAALSLAVAMDGHFLSIPNSTKRTLAMIYPKYRGRGREGLHDTFRQEVHAYAKDIIRQHPFVGRRGFRMDSQTVYWMLSRQSGDQSGHAYAGSWHSAFYGYAADFGIPCLVFYLFFLWISLRQSFQYSRRIPLGTYSSASYLFYSFAVLQSAATMITSGHSSLTTQDAMIRFGMLLAIANGFDSEQSQRQYLAETSPMS